jgi:hypothetical protein
MNDRDDPQIPRPPEQYAKEQADGEDGREHGNGE